MLGTANQDDESDALLLKVECFHVKIIVSLMEFVCAIRR